MNKDFLIKPILLDLVLPLRQEVLRQGLPLKECRFDCDDVESTLHLGLFESGSTDPLAILTLAAASHADLESEALQLRGMAVKPSFQQKGFGTLLLNSAIQEAEKRNRLLWCNARTEAVSFYLKNNFQIHGEPFLIAGVGEHVVMYHQSSA